MTARLATVLFMHNAPDDTVTWALSHLNVESAVILAPRDHLVRMLRVAHVAGMLPVRALAQTCEAFAPMLLDRVDEGLRPNANRIVRDGAFHGLDRRTQRRASLCLFMLMNDAMVDAVTPSEQALVALADGMMIAGHPSAKTRAALFSVYLDALSDMGIYEETIRSTITRYAGGDLVDSLERMTLE